MVISCDDHLCASVDCQCQEHVVSEIILDSCDFGGHVYDFTDLYQVFDDGLNFFRRETELPVGENPNQFGNRVFGDQQSPFFVADFFNRLTRWTFPKITRNEDVCIEDYRLATAGPALMNDTLDLLH